MFAAAGAPSRQKGGSYFGAIGEFSSGTDKLDNARVHGTTNRVAQEAFANDRAHLRPLPLRAYDAVLTVECLVRPVQQRRACIRGQRAARKIRLDPTLGTTARLWTPQPRLRTVCQHRGRCLRPLNLLTHKDYRNFLPHVLPPAMRFPG